MPRVTDSAREETGTCRGGALSYSHLGSEHLTGAVLDRLTHRCRILAAKGVESREVPLHPQARRALLQHRQLRHLQGDLVFPWIGEDGKAYYVDENRIKHPFRRITRRAGLPTIRFHDVRHSFASQSTMRGESLCKIGKLLGHKRPQTAERYARLSPASLDHVGRSS